MKKKRCLTLATPSVVLEWAISVSFYRNSNWQGPSQTYCRRIWNFTGSPGDFTWEFDTCWTRSCHEFKLPHKQWKKKSHKYSSLKQRTSMKYFFIVNTKFSHVKSRMSKMSPRRISHRFLFSCFKTLLWTLTKTFPT